MSLVKIPAADAWFWLKPRITSRFGLTLIVLLASFAWPLFNLLRFAIHSELYSYVALVPFISLYLGWVNRRTLPPPSAPDRRLAAGLLLAGVLVLGGYGTALLNGPALAPEDSLALTTLAFLLFFAGVCGWFVGRPTLRATGFPLGFLIFMVPFPVFLLDWIEMLLQHGSAAVALALFKLGGTPVYYHDLVFQLPNISLMVAPECSGIHSTLALFITSLVAGKLFLRRPWKSAVLALAVVPIALFRNGLRVFTVGELCVHIGPEMIDSYIHRHGGPVFFVLSLIPLFLLLRWLFPKDRQSKPAQS